MKSLGTSFLSVLLACPLPAQQTAPSTQTAHPAQKTISRQLGLHAFPAKNQNGEQQQTDELSCYNWAKQDTAFDPLAALTAAQSTKSTSTAAGAPPFGATTGGRRSHGSGERSCARSHRWRCGQRRSYLEEANARQLVSRARQHVADGQHSSVNSAKQRSFLAAFLVAAQKGALAKLESFLVGSADGMVRKRERPARTGSILAEPITAPRRHRWPLVRRLDAKVA